MAFITDIFLSQRNLGIRSKNVLFFLVCVVLTSCGIQIQSKDNSAISACSLENFSLFIDGFSISKSKQIKYTNIPLQKLYIDLRTDPEPSAVEIKLESNQIVFPVFPDKKNIKKRKLSMNISTSGDKAEVRVSKSDTDYLVTYFFKHKSCWHLFRIEDWSL